jgi:hypothetical protein
MARQSPGSTRKPPADWPCRLSRWVNRRLTGRECMVCTSLYRDGSRLVPVVDVLMWPVDWARFGTTRMGHCRRCYLWENHP